MTEANLKETYPKCVEAGLVYLYDGKPRLNENKFFASLEYQEVLNFEFGVSSIKRGKVKIKDVENYLAGRT